MILTHHSCKQLFCLLYNCLQRLVFLRSSFSNRKRINPLKYLDKVIDITFCIAQQLICLPKITFFATLKVKCVILS